MHAAPFLPYRAGWGKAAAPHGPLPFLSFCSRTSFLIAHRHHHNTPLKVFVMTNEFARLDPCEMSSTPSPEKEKPPEGGRFGWEAD